MLTNVVLMYCLSIFDSQLFASSKDTICVGAYYFDGWTGKTEGHLTQKLIKEFPERQSKWGWITSTSRIMKKQIKLASKAGIDFFSFCWYYRKTWEDNLKVHPLNQGLNLFLTAKNKNLMRFNLLVANHKGNELGPKEWPNVCSIWINLFKDPVYLKYDHKPLITFFSVNSLVQQFGSYRSVKLALDSLRTLCIKSGLKGVTIAACTEPTKEAVEASISCGFDVLTGYNYHQYGFPKGRNVAPISELDKSSLDVWSYFSSRSLPYIPVVTLNWDPRPWSPENNQFPQTKYYEGYSNESVYASIINVKEWCRKYSQAPKQKQVVMLFAWNEYGEGAWLTPSKTGGQDFLRSVKRALKE